MYVGLVYIYIRIPTKKKKERRAAKMSLWAASLFTIKRKEKKPSVPLCSCVPMDGGRERERCLKIAQGENTVLSSLPCSALLPQSVMPILFSKRGGRGRPCFLAVPPKTRVACTPRIAPFICTYTYTHAHFSPFHSFSLAASQLDNSLSHSLTYAHTLRALSAGKPIYIPAPFFSP